MPWRVPNSAPLPSMTMKPNLSNKGFIVGQRENERRAASDRPVVVGEQGGEGLRVKLVVAEVEGRVDRLERLKVDVDFFLLPLVRDDGAAVSRCTPSAARAFP